MSMIDTEHLIRLMNKVPFFKDFTIEEKELILGEYSFIKRYQPKEYIIEQGQIDKSLFVLLKGSVCVTRNEHPGMDIKKLKEGSIFGEMSILTEKPRSTNVIAHNDVILLSINGKNFDRLDDDIKTKFKNRLIEILSDHLEEMNQLLGNRLFGDKQVDK